MQRDAYDKTSAVEFIGTKKKRSKKSKQRNRSINLLVKTAHDKSIPKDLWWRMYRLYLQSKRWKAFREKIFRDRLPICERCCRVSGRQSVHLHHLTYARLGRELPEDVRILCHGCHQLMHPNKKIL